MRIVVIGVGNPYRADDGVGPTVVERLERRNVDSAVLARSLGEATELIDLWTGADLAIVVDAVLADPAHPGRVHRLVVQRPPAGRDRAASSHGMGLGEAVELARVLDRLPGELVLYAVEVDRVDYGEGLSPPVARAAERLAGDIAAEVTARRTPAEWRWACSAPPRDGSACAPPGVS
jgi:hydrogenase maturation protease